MNIKILKLNVIIFPMDIHSSNSAFRDYVLNYPCAPCRRFKLPFKVPVSYHSWTRMEPSPVRPRRQKDYACSHPIHRDMHVYLLHTTSSHSLLVLSSPYCELFMSAWHRLHDVDVELNAAPWFPSFLLFPPPSAAKDARLLAAYRSLIHSRMKIIPPPFCLLRYRDTFHFPIRLFLDSWALFPALCRRVDEKIFARKRSRNALLKDVKAFWNETL